MHDAAQHDAAQSKLAIEINTMSNTISNTCPHKNLQLDELYATLDFREYRDTIMNLQDAARVTGVTIPQEILEQLEKEKSEYLKEAKEARKTMRDLGLKRLRMTPTK